MKRMFLIVLTLGAVVSVSGFAGKKADGTCDPSPEYKNGIQGFRVLPEMGIVGKWELDSSLSAEMLSGSNPYASSEFEITEDVSVLQGTQFEDPKKDMCAFIAGKATWERDYKGTVQKSDLYFAITRTAVSDTHICLWGPRNNMNCNYIKLVAGKGPSGAVDQNDRLFLGGDHFRETIAAYKRK